MVTKALDKILAIACIISTLKGANSVKDCDSSACKPTEACKEQTVPGSFVMDPLDCTKYYVCLGSPPFMYPADSPLQCSDGYYFNSTEGQCVYDNGVACQNPCDCGPNLSCQTECLDGVDFLGDPNSCSAYYQCSPAGPVLYDCAIFPNLYFNGTVCQSDITKCCDLCDAYCEVLYTQIRDPYDCTKFYICLSLGLVTEDMHSHCPEGQHFDPDTTLCEQGDTCTPYCNS